MKRDINKLYMSISDLKKIVKRAENLHEYKGYSDTILIRSGVCPIIELQSYYSDGNDCRLVDFVTEV